MSKDKIQGTSKDGIASNGEGLKRRDLLLSGTSLMAASALLGVRVSLPPAQAQQAASGASGKPPNIVFHHRAMTSACEHRRLPSRP